MEKEETWYIEYLNKDKNFKKSKKTFKGETSYEDAIIWGKKNLENFNLDMIKYQRNDE